MGDRAYLRTSLVTLVVILVLVPWVIWATQQTLQSTRNRPALWVSEQFEQRRNFDRFVDNFGTHNQIVVSWKGCTVDDERLKAVEQRLQSSEKTPGGQAYNALFTDVTTGYTVLRALMDEPIGLSRPAALNRLYQTLVGPDGETSCAVIGVTRIGDEMRHEALEIILDIVQEEVGLPRDEIHLAGDIVDGIAIDAENNRSNFLALPSALFSLVVCWFCLRSFRLTGAVLIVASFGEGLVFALVHAFGLTMNAVFSVMAPLVFVLTVSAGVHLVNYFYEKRKDGYEGAVERALRDGWAPCTLAAVTTAIGLGSLIVSDILPVRQFGMISSLGVLLTTGLLFLVVPGAMVARGRSKGVPAVAAKVSEGRFWRWLTKGVGLSPSLLALVGILVIGSVGYGIRWIRTSVSVRDLLVANSRTLQDYRWLEERIGPLVPIEIIVHFDGGSEMDLLRRVELLSDIERQLVENDIESLGGVTSAATFTPPIPPPGGFRRTARRTTIRNRLEDQLPNLVDGHLLHVPRVELSLEALPSDDVFRQLDATRLPDALQAVLAERGVRIGEDAEVIVVEEGSSWRIQDLRDEAPGEGGSYSLRKQDDSLEVYLTGGPQSWRISTRAPALGDVDYGVLLEKVRGHVNPLIEEAFEEWRELKEKSDRRRRENARDVGELATATASSPSAREPTISATFTGLTPLVYTAQRALLHDLVVSFLTALALVTVVMILVQRSLAAGLLAMAPNVFPSAVLFGAMGWLGFLVDIGTVMTASVALGIAVDGTLHFLTWYRRERREGSTPVEAVERTYRHCGVAMTQTTLICGLGLMVFIISGFIPTRKFALMMVALLTAALVGDLVLLPALLLSPLGRLKSLSR